LRECDQIFSHLRNEGGHARSPQHHPVKVPVFGQVLEENHHLLWWLLEGEVPAINWPGFRYQTIKDSLTRTNEQVCLSR